jgi:hypothetical protein
MTRARLLVAALLLVASVASCRLLSGEILCRRDRDCPDDLPDAGELYCTSWDAGIGTCTTDDEFDGDFIVDLGDGGIDVPVFPDGGSPDGGAPMGPGGLFP